MTAALRPVLLYLLLGLSVSLMSVSIDLLDKPKTDAPDLEES